MGPEQPSPIVFLDALGDPIGQATVEVFLRTNYSPEGPRGLIMKSRLNEVGALQLAPNRRQAGRINFTLIHPDYGIAIGDYYSHRSPEVVHIPLVKRGTEAYARSIRGIVVDSNNVAIPDAFVKCSNIRTLGEGLISSRGGEEYKALTNEQGEFFFYLPNNQGRKLIPPKSVYHVRIEAPGELDLMPYQGTIGIGETATIVLEQGQHLHTFAFDDGTGLITEAEKLKRIHILITRPNRSRISLGYGRWKDGGIFPLGTYKAMMGTDEGEVEFLPMEVTEQSPDELVFTFPEATVYYGRVIHGLTEEPMPGAFVIGMWSSSNGNLSHITPEQWENLHDLPSDPCVDDEAIKPIREIYGFNKVVRTDEDGRFEMTYEQGEDVYGFIAFEEDFLGIRHRKHALEPDENRMVRVPTFRLFPAAKVIVETKVAEKHVSIMPQWVIDKENSPSRVKDFLNIDDDRETHFTYRKWLEENQVESFYVPAGINLKIRLGAPYDRQWCPITIDETINLRQGEVYDLGTHEFQPALVISIRVLNSSNQPVEGVPVHLVVGGIHWGVVHITDVNGITEFHTPPHSSAELGVHCFGEGVRLKETIFCEIGGEEDMNRQFELTLSDELLYHLFKK